MKKAAFLFFAALAFLALTVPANQLEAEDAYYYARMVEQGSGVELFHPHHLLYLPLSRVAFRCAQAGGYTGRAFPLLIALSALSAAAAVTLFARLLADAANRPGGVPLRRTARGKTTERQPPAEPGAVAPALGRRRFPVPWFALALLFSYGFWRYGVTAEIYLPALALMLGALVAAVGAQRLDGRFGVGAALSVAAGLMHLVSLPLVLAAIPALYVLRRRRRLAIVHALVVAGGIAAAYGAVAAGPGWRGFADPAVARDGLTQPFTWVKAAAAAGQTLLSGNFLFAWPSAGDALQRIFPSRMLQEELFLGRQAAAWVRWLAPVTCAAALAGLVAVWLRILARLRATRAEPDALRGSALVWLAGSAALALWTEPANPEMWIAALAPFWLLTARLWPAVASESRAVKLAPAALTVLLLAHNGVGGWALIASPRSDYARAKFAWLNARAKPGDLIVTAESYSVVTRQQYVLPARVADAKFLRPEDWPALRASVRGRIFVMGDVLEPVAALLRRDPAAVARLRALADEIRPGLALLHADEWGGVYEYAAAPNPEDR